MTIFTGTGTAVCTPFDTNDNINPDAYARLIQFQVENSTDAIVTCGTTGEISTLDDDEHVEVARLAVEAVKAATHGTRRIPVIAGAGTNDTRHSITLAKRLEKQAQVDALMVVTPYYNKTSQKGLVAHFAAVAAAVNVPIVVYNVPSRTGLNLLPKTLLEMSKIENIVAVKEASGNITQIAEVCALCAGHLDIYSGNDDHVVPVLSLGGKGVISTTSNIAPQPMHDMVAKFLAGDISGAARIQLQLLDLMKLLFTDVNPMPVKAALNLMGFDMGHCRLPLTTIEESLQAALSAEMKKLGLL